MPGQHLKLLETLLKAVIATYCICFLFLGFLVSPWDFDHLAGYYEIAWHFWRTQSGLPHYNPFISGGRSLGGDPQSFLFSPWTAFVPLIGSIATVKLQLFSELALGTWGLTRWLSSFSLSKPEKTWGVFLFLTSGAVVSKMLTGHITLGFYFLYPLFLWLSYQMEKKEWFRSHAFLFYCLLFIYCGNHKPNFFIYGLLPLCIEVVIRCLFLKNMRPILALGLGVLFSAGVNAVSLIPSQQYFTDFPRHDGAEWVPIPMRALIANLLLPLRSIPEWFYGPRFLQRHEYNIFVGPAVFGFSFLGFKKLKTTYPASFWSLLLTSLLCVFLGMGSDTPDFQLLQPFTWFFKIWPGFSSIRVPTRFWFFLTFPILLGSAFAFSAIRSKKALILFWAFGVVPLFLSCIINLSKTALFAKETQFTTSRVLPTDFEWVENPIETESRYLREGRGVLNSIDNMTFQRNPYLKKGRLLESVTLDPSRVKLSWKDWKTISVEATMSEPTLVTLNLNAHPYWSFQGVGAEVIKQRGPSGLTLLLAKGETRGVAEFKQPKVYEGYAVTLLSLALLIGYAAWIIFQNKKPKGLYIVGLTGGIASGKSTVAALLKKHGIPVLNLDHIGSELLENDPKIQKRLLSLCGTLNKLEMREFLFKNNHNKKAFEKIMHPAIWRSFYAKAKAMALPKSNLIVCEAALLIESGKLDRFQELVVVFADESTRRTRLLQRDPISEELAKKMFENQTTDEERKIYATTIVENNGDPTALEEILLPLIQRWKDK